MDFKIYNYLQVDNLLRYFEMGLMCRSLLLWYLKIGPIHVVTFYCHYKYILLTLQRGPLGWFSVQPYKFSIVVLVFKFQSLQHNII